MKFRSFLLSLVVLFLVAGCSDSTDSVPDPTPLSALGKANLNSPLVGASIEVRDGRGQHVMTSEETTDAAGTFALKLPAGNSSRFRLVVTGGTYEGKPFQDRLLLDVERFDPDRDLLYVNAATTLISRYMDRHAGASVADASTKVKAFLLIPATSRAGVDVDNPLQNYFRHEILLAAMQSSGVLRLGAYLDGLVDEIDAGIASHAFSRPKAPLLGGSEDAVKYLLKFLAKAIGDDTVSLAFEHIMTALGLDGTAEILRELHEINHKLDELKDLTTEVLNAVNQGNMQALMAELNGEVSNIKGHYDFLTLVAQRSAFACQLDAKGAPLDPKCPQAHQQKLDDLKTDIRKHMAAILDAGPGGVQSSINHIHDSLLQGGGPGVLAAARVYTKGVMPFDPPVVNPRLIQINDYYKTMQAMGVQLLVEAYKASDPKDYTPSAAKTRSQDALDTNTRFAALQDAAVAKLRRENEDTVEDMRTKLIWLRAPYINIPLPYDGFESEASRLCESLAKTNYAGSSGWRLPTDPELHAVVKGLTSNEGNADGEPGIFDRLVAQGFQAGPGNGSLNQRGFLTDRGSAYFSSTKSGISGVYYEALWDAGVDYACIDRDLEYCGFPTNIPKVAGAWCVAAGKPE